MMKKLIKSSVLCSLLLTLTACSLGPVATPEVAHYFLQPNNHATLSPGGRVSKRSELERGSTKQKRQTILLANIQSAPGYQTSAMHYVITPYQLQAFTTHAWVSPPAKLWQPLLASALQQSGIGMIVHTPTPAQTHYRLDVRLDRFEQNFQKPQSVFMMQATATLQNTKSGRVIGEHTFHVNVPAQANTPYAGVLAANTAVGEMNQKIARYTAHLLPA